MSQRVPPCTVLCLLQQRPSLRLSSLLVLSGERPTSGSVAPCLHFREASILFHGASDFPTYPFRSAAADSAVRRGPLKSRERAVPPCFLGRRTADTEAFYTEVQTEILKQFGKEFTWDLKVKMMGKKSLESATILVDECQLHGLLSPEAFLKQREEMLHALFPSTKLMPGAERLIRHLHKHSVPMAVATSSHRHHFNLKTENHRELFSLMHHIVCGDDPKVPLGKPNPGIFLEAASRFEPPPTDSRAALVFEDAPLGVDAALRANMPVVMVPDARTDPELCKLATKVLKSLEEFNPSHFGLPAFS